MKAPTNSNLLIRQFTSPIILILFIATLISILVGDVIDGLIILAIIIPSGLLSYFQEARAGKIMESLLQQLATQVLVRRSGVDILIESADLTLGDVVVLKGGDLIPADLTLIHSEALMVDESSLSGESFPIEKSTGEIYFGTHVVSGSALATVFALGNQTRFGKLEESLQSSSPKTSFEIGIEQFGRLIAKAMGILVIAIFFINIYFHRPLLESLLFSLALAVGLTPQLLPAIISVSLSSGARSMASKKVLIKRLDVIEDFGSMTALCTDKTGTLTVGVVNLSSAIDVEGKASVEVLKLASLNAGLQESFDNPIDGAILAAHPLSSNLTRRDEIPYDFNRRRLTVLASDGTAISKGAFNSIVQICTKAELAGSLVPISEAIEGARKLFAELSAEGGRVLGIATRDCSTDEITVSDERDFVLRGFLVFLDPPKDDAHEAIDHIKSLGIEPFLITGDNSLAASFIGEKVGLYSHNVMSGSELSKISDTQLDKALEEIRIFAEVDPLQKERIVIALKRLGHTVGFFGDGINDCAAIKAADVGISVSNAVPVAKSAAAVVLLEANLKVLADGVQVGRKTFLNTMKYIQVGLSAAFGNMLSMAIASLFLPFLPLLPMQILLLNFLSDFPALMIAGDNADPENLLTPRRWDLGYIRKFMVIFGLISSLFDLATFWILINLFHADEVLFRSAWFIESTLTELIVMIVLRTQRPFWKSRPGKGLAISSGLLAMVVLALPYLWVGPKLQLDGVPATLLLTFAALITVYAGINESVKRMAQRKLVRS
ncbi:MAG: magnesium-translocating P-type ATPase [Candidatus Planktophila sp.]